METAICVGQTAGSFGILKDSIRCVCRLSVAFGVPKLDGVLRIRLLPFRRALTPETGFDVTSAGTLRRDCRAFQRHKAILRVADPAGINLSLLQKFLPYQLPGGLLPAKQWSQ